ncbi:MAG: HAD family hydrolase [Anaerolineae bacterium]
MIRAMIFDLDGTLVQTERLKAISYAQAVQELCPFTVTEGEVLEYFKNVVGLSRQEVAEALVEHYQLAAHLQPRLAELGVSTLWQGFIQIRLRYYEALIADPEVLRQSIWPHNVELLRRARQTTCRTALATMSHCLQVQYILGVLGFNDLFDFVATRDDVEHGKPDPEIYQLIARQFHIVPEECLVIEDSLAGVQAAVAAGMQVIAVTTPFTRDAVNMTDVLDHRWIVNEPALLLPTVAELVDLVPVGI